MGRWKFNDEVAYRFQRLLTGATIHEGGRILGNYEYFCALKQSPSSTPLYEEVMRMAISRGEAPKRFVYPSIRTARVFWHDGTSEKVPLRRLKGE